jgi:pimeloyl-ACP methyl ester carboxylesterase
VATITGDDDRVVPLEDSVELATLMSGSTLRVIPNIVHLHHEETPVEFLDAFQDALLRLIP